MSQSLQTEYASDVPNYLTTDSFSILAGCGFAPVYGPQSDGSKFLSSIAVASPKPSRASYKLVSALEERLGRNDTGSLILEHNISIGESGLGVSDRIQVIGSVNYTLKRQLDGALVANGIVKSFTSYSSPIGQSLLGGAREDAIERLIIILADRVLTDLIASGQIS